jgi:hypothetical protein
MSRNLRKDPAGHSLPTSIEHRIKLYSLAATAAGVGMLALSQPAAGEVVYTKAKIYVSPFGGTASIDLNNDGKPDFQFTAPAGGYDHSFYASLLVGPLRGGEVVGGHRQLHSPYASALAGGAKIGPSAHFSSSAVRGNIIVERSIGFASASTFKQFVGSWNFPNGTNHYVGVKFLIDGATHYGWIRLTINLANSMQSVITGYAYETVPDKPITAGAGMTSAEATADQPRDVQSPKEVSKTTGPSLGMLALGASALPLWRRD